MKPLRLTRLGLLLAVLASVAALRAQTTATEYCALGSHDRQQGHIDAAIADFSKAIELNPKYAVAYNDRGGAKRFKGDYDGAIADYTKAIEVNPQFAAAYSNRGVAKRFKGDLDGAIADFTKAMELDPKHVIGASNLASVKKMKEHPRDIAKKTRGDELADLSESENQRLINAGEPNDKPLPGRDPRDPR